MRLNSIRGKFLQLRRSPPALWGAFALGWINRNQNQQVPCVISGARKLLQVPVRDFYESYEFFCEQPSGIHELGFLLGKLRPSDVFYDVGGVRGVYSAAAKLKFQDAISVHIFEPLAQNAGAIEAVSVCNAFTGFKINRLAVGDGSVISGNVNEQDAMLRLGDQHATQGTKFPSVSLDEYVSQGHPVPTVMKIDVDGFELHVLRGGQKVIRQHRPRLWLEIHPEFLKNQGQSADAVLNWLAEAGYTLSKFDDFHLPSSKVSYHVWCE